MARGLGAVALAVVFGLIVANFDVLLGLTEPSVVLSWVHPAIVVMQGVIGIVGTLRLRRTHPVRYSRIGHGEEGKAHHLGDDD